MFNDPLSLNATDATGGTDTVGDFALMDLGPGSSVRVGSISGLTGKAQLSISHSESKENKGQITDRTAVRLQCRRTLDTGVDVVAQATMTFSSPRVGFTVAEVALIVDTLTSSLRSSFDLSNVPATSVSVASTVARLAAGEP